MESQYATDLTAADLEFLAFALGLAADRMADYSDEFDETDEASLEKLRRMAAQKAVGHATVLETTNAYEAQPTQLTRRVLTPNEHDRAWHAIEGAAGTPGADPGTVLNAVLHALRIEAPTAEAEQAKCAKCQQHFDPADTRFNGRAQQDGTPYCRGCVDRCHESTDAFHVCVICR